MHSICGLKLGPSNLIFVASLEYLVEEALAKVGRGAWAKTRESIKIDFDLEFATGQSFGSREQEGEKAEEEKDEDEEDHEMGVTLIKRRTFLTFVKAISDAEGVV